MASRQLREVVFSLASIRALSIRLMPRQAAYWSFQADASVRNSINVGPVKGQGSAKQGISFGDVRANVYMLDAETGKQLWKVKVEDHPLARITGAPTLYEGRLYV